jgi:hypothetical protein
MEPKNPAVLRQIVEGQRLHLRRVRAIEKILVSEYNDACTEFDRAKERNAPAWEVKATCERYIHAMERLRRFLADGEIPSDVEDRLEKVHDSGIKRAHVSEP